MSFSKDYPPCPFAIADTGNFEIPYLENGRCIASVTNKQIQNCCNSTASWLVKHSQREVVIKVKDQISDVSNADKQRLYGVTSVLQIAQL